MPENKKYANLTKQLAIKEKNKQLREFLLIIANNLKIDLKLNNKK